MSDREIFESRLIDRIHNYERAVISADNATWNTSLSEETTEKVKQHRRQALRQFVMDFYDGKKGIKTKTREKKQKYPSDKDIERVLYALPDYLFFPTVCILTTGMDHFDVTNLRRKDLDLKKKVAVIKTRADGKQRTVRLNERVLSVIGGLTKKRKINPDDYFFKKPNGKFLNAQSFSRAFNNVVLSLNIMSFCSKDLHRLSIRDAGKKTGYDEPIKWRVS